MRRHHSRGISGFGIHRNRAIPNSLVLHRDLGGWRRDRAISGNLDDENTPEKRKTCPHNFEVGISLHQILRPIDVHVKRKTKIICAIGPSCWTKQGLGELIDAGMNVARLNFSHGSHELHGKSVANLRAAMDERSGCHCAILMDTKGPEIRTGLLHDHQPLALKAGQFLEIGIDPDYLGNSNRISCSYPHLPTSVKPGGTILCADGTIVMKVIECHQDYIVVQLQNSCILEERKNMNLPGASIKITGITPKDRNDIQQFGIVNKVDIISGSFVRSAENIRAIRECLGMAGRHIRVHAKIESLEALLNLDEILAEADGVHVSRGDLGMELEPEQVFLAQKMIISKANILGKPVVTSTQMLQSMTTNSIPTHAECSDVANAVIDGTDAVMLSGETANGRFPREAVATMSRICKEAEGCLDYPELYRAIRNATPKPVSISEAVASSAVATLLDMNAKLLVVLSETGKSALYIAKYRPSVPILVVTPSSATAHQMEGLSRGVHALLVDSMLGTDSVILRAIEFAKDKKWVTNGDYVVTVHGVVEATTGKTNIVKVIKAVASGFTSPSSSVKIKDLPT